MNEKDTTLLQEYSKLVNELVDARRELARLNTTLRDKEKFLSKVITMAPSTVCILDLESGRIEYSSRPFRAFLGISLKESDTNEVLSSIISVDDRSSVDEHHRAMAHAKEDEVRIIDFRISKGDGSIRWLRAKETSFVRDARGITKKVLGVLDDVTEQKEKEESLRRDSVVDLLTGLLNRRGFLSSSELILRSANIRSLPCAIGFFDINDFKAINDTYGHAEGDLALKLMADAMRMTFRSSDILGRFGGDEFIVFISDVTPDTIPPILDRMKRNVDSIAQSSNKPWSLSYSIGCSFFSPLGSSDLEKLIASADAEMYRDKTSGKQSS